MDYSPRNFPDTFAQLVSEATATLPPLIKPEHEDMLLIATEDTITMFWNQYIDLLPAEAKNAYLKAGEDETGKALFDWSHTYANFAENDEAEALGKKVLADLAQQLPQMLRLMYDDVEDVNVTTQS